MDGQPDGRSRWFTVTHAHGRTTYGIWAIDPIAHAPAGDKFSEVIEIAAGPLNAGEVAYLYETLGHLIGERVEIPEARRIGQ